MNIEEERIESLSEIVANLNISLTEEQIKTIVRDFSLHIEMESEMASYQHVGYKEECQDCKRHKSALREANDIIQIFTDSVKTRRNATEVWIEDGDVKYK